MASAEMAEYVQRVGEQPSELLVEEWNLLPLAHKNAIGSRRAAWRVITSVEQKEKFKGIRSSWSSHAREYVAKVEGELQKIRDGILALMDKKLIPSPSTDESKTFYYKMKVTITVTLPNLQQAMQRAKPAKMLVSLMRKPPRLPRKTWS